MAVVTGFVFPEKLLFSNDTSQTMHRDEMQTLLCNGDNDFSPTEKGLSGNKHEKYCVGS